MTIKMNLVEGMDADVGWANYDPSDWRKHPDTELGGKYENDEDRKTPRGVVGILGFDPDDEGWD